MNRSMRIRCGAALLAAVVCATPVAVSAESKSPKEKRAEQAGQIATAANRFAWALYGQLADGDAGNVFFSPQSIHTALAMAHVGARGETADQMYRLLRLPMREQGRQPGGAGPVELEEVPWPTKDVGRAYGSLLDALKVGRRSKVVLRAANALWRQRRYPWSREYVKTMQFSFRSGSRVVDFKGDPEKARRAINRWVEQETKRKIKELFEPNTITAATRLVLANAIYFKGTWASPFKVRSTREAPFHISADKTVQTRMMNQGEKFGFAETDLVKILKMPYAGKEISMIVFLPKEVEGLAAVEKWLVETGPDEALKGLKETKLAVSFPKFAMTWGDSLNDTLKAMGMTDAFDGNKADFTGMSERAKEDKLAIALVVHKAFVSVNEKGTEAAAATGVSIAATGYNVPPSFRADRPFAFIIRHEKTGVILFAGRVLDPTAETKKDAKAEDEKEPIPSLN